MLRVRDRCRWTQGTGNPFIAHALFLRHVHSDGVVTKEGVQEVVSSATDRTLWATQNGVQRAVKLQSVIVSVAGRPKKILAWHSYKYEALVESAKHCQRVLSCRLSVYLANAVTFRSRIFTLRSASACVCRYNYHR